MPFLSIMVGASLANFAEKPIASQLEEGAKIAAKGKGIERVLGLNRVVFGTWFDGERNQDVECAVILTPGLLSRWLGHQQACGALDAQKSWERFASQSKGKTLVFVRLASLNTMDLTDGDESETGQPGLLDEVSVGFGQMSNRRSLPAQFEPMPLKRVQDVQDRHAHDVLKTTWDQVASRVVAWPSAPAGDSDSPIRWGKNRLVGFIGELPDVSNLSFGAFRIQTGSVIRTVRFDMPKS